MAFGEPADSKGVEMKQWALMVVVILWALTLFPALPLGFVIYDNYGAIYAIGFGLLEVANSAAFVTRIAR